MIKEITDNINDYFNSINLLEAKSYKNMTVIGISSDTSNKVDLMTLDVGLDMGLVEISEIDGGVVGQIKLVNKAVTPLLIIDGEEIEGAKQNRIVNSTVIIAAESEKIINVSCVEEGRWSHKTKHFKKSRHMASSSTRGQKSRDVYASLKTDNSYVSNQANVWKNISEIQCSLEVNSSTGAQKDTYENMSYLIDEYKKHLTNEDNQNGMIVLINSKIVGMELLYDSINYAKYHDKLIESYIIDAINNFEDSEHHCDEKKVTREFLDEIIEAKKELFDTDNEGDDYRIDTDKITGFTVVYDSNIINSSVLLSA